MKNRLYNLPFECQLVSHNLTKWLFFFFFFFIDVKYGISKILIFMFTLLNYVLKILKPSTPNYMVQTTERIYDLCQIEEEFYYLLERTVLFV